MIAADMHRVVNIIGRVTRTTTVVALVGAPHALAGQRVQTPAPTVTYRLVPAASHVSYSVNEVFIEENNRLFTAVGSAPGVSGAITLNFAQPSQSTVRGIVADLRQLTSDSERRDRAIRERFLESRRYPYARLDSVTVSGVPQTLTAGQSFAFQLVGTLNVHNVSRRTTWRGEARLAGDTLRGQATTQVLMSHFGIEVPRFLWLRVADAVTLEIQFAAVRDSTRPDDYGTRDPTPTRSTGGLR